MSSLVNQTVSPKFDGIGPRLDLSNNLRAASSNLMTPVYFQMHFPPICLGSSSSIDVNAFGLEINQRPVSAWVDGFGYYVGIFDFEKSLYDVDDNSSARGSLAQVDNIRMQVFAHAKDTF